MELLGSIPMRNTHPMTAKASNWVSVRISAHTIPMIASGSLLWGPLGSVICFGLIFALVLSLLLMPVLYYLFHRKDFNKVEASEQL